MSKRNPYYAGPVSDHFDGLRFFNPGQGSTDRGLRDILKWQLGGRRAKWPTLVAVTPTKPEPRVEGLAVTMVGHASVLIQLEGVNILVDPVWSERASPIGFAGPRRVTAPGIAFEDLPPIDLVLVTHNHYDHLDLATLRRIEATHAPLVVTPLGNDVVLRRAVAAERIVTLDWHGEHAVGDVRITCVPANHWSSRGLGDRRMALWGGFVIRTASRLVYNVGDTGFGDGRIFGEVKARHGSPDVAIIPIGAYAPRWFMKDQHVDPAEALRIMAACGAARAVGVHWGTFQLTDEARDEPRVRLAEAVRARGLDAAAFVALEPGQCWSMAVG